MKEGRKIPSLSNLDPLKTYREKRDFEKTAEPEPSDRTARSSEPLFVVQKHLSRSLHYDLRLEADGVLKSFAVPKGPSMNPADKRLAIETEDHPMEYASFQGRIPEGQYGAGEVVVWDNGIYRNLSQKEGEDISLAQALKEGHAKFWLEGKKLSGGFALTRTKRGWLLVKMRDERADSSRDILKERPESVLNRAVSLRHESQPERSG